MGPHSRIHVCGFDCCRGLVWLRRSIFERHELVIPKQFTEAPFTHAIPPGTEWWNIWRLMGPEGWSGTGAVLNVPAMFIVAVITILLVIGIKESANFSNVVVAIKVESSSCSLPWGCISQRGQLATLRSGPRRRKVWMVGRFARGGCDLFRLYWL